MSQRDGRARQSPPGIIRITRKFFFSSRSDFRRIRVVDPGTYSLPRTLSVDSFVRKRSPVLGQSLRFHQPRRGLFLGGDAYVSQAAQEPDISRVDAFGSWLGCTACVWTGS